MRKIKLEIIKCNHIRGGQIISNWCERNDSIQLEQNSYLFKDDLSNKYIAIDNRDNNCWVEEFTSLTDALKYLII